MTIDGATKLFPGITYGVSDTSDGNMSFTWGPTEEVIRNREVFLRGNGLKLEDCAVMSLQHEEKIVIDPNDTAQSPRFYSHYRSLRTGEPEGRFATIIGLK